MINIIDKIFLGWFILVLYITIMKVIEYSYSKIPMSSIGVRVTLPKLLLMFHIFVMIYTLAYLTLQPFIKKMPHDPILLAYLQILGYIAIIPYDRFILSIRGNKARVLNHGASLLNIIILFNIKKNKYIRYLMIILLNAQGILPIFIQDFKKFILKSQ